MNKKPANQHHIFRIDLAREGRVGTHGYQVRIELKGNTQRKLFSDSVIGSKQKALEEAKEWRDARLEEMGIIESGSRISIILQANNKSGIIGINRFETIDENEIIREYWQTTFLSPEQKITNRKFNIKLYGELGALQQAINARMEALSDLIHVPEFFSSENNIKFLIDRYLNILVYLEDISPQEEEILLKTIMDHNIKNTTKEDIINGRIGQQNFKEKIAVLWGRKCAITESKLLLNASHIKPWAKCNNKERLDPYNGFLLSPLYDRAFDEGYISFKDNGEILVSKDLNDDHKRLNFIGNECINSISPFNASYLEYHRSNIYRGNHP